jgi:hypothetical protein
MVLWPMMVITPIMISVMRRMMPIRIVVIIAVIPGTMASIPYTTREQDNEKKKSK